MRPLVKMVVALSIGLVVGPLLIWLAQSIYVSNSSDRQMTQALQLLTQWDGAKRELCMDCAPHPDAEVEACHLDPARFLGDPTGNSFESFKSGQWSNYNGLFDLLIYRNAYYDGWIRARRAERLAKSTSVQWRVAISDCLDLPGLGGWCMSRLGRRLETLRLSSPNSLPNDAPRPPLEERSQRVICTFAAGLTAKGPQ